MGDSVLFSFTITAVTISISELQVLGTVTQWVLYFYLVYRFVPQLFPSTDPAAEVYDNTGFKVLCIVFTASVSVWLIPVSPTVGNFSIGAIDINQVMWHSMWFAVASTLIAAYVHLYWFRSAPADKRVNFAAQSMPFNFPIEEREEEVIYQSHGGWVSIFHTMTLFGN